jgi:3-methyladenine DNA glycosylase AlkC
MAEQLKTFFSPALVRRLAKDIAGVLPTFAPQTFIGQATKGLDELELIERGKHIARALGDHLPTEYREAIRVLLASLGPEHAEEELLGVGMAPFFYLPHVIFVAERGLDHFDVSMRAQYELTKRFSAESSIRPYIAKYPDRTFATLRKWAKDRNAHVRRLVSEGTRLRLPWASRVPWLDANPSRIVELLELLKDDPTTLVRRSVANNLNDLGKVHRELMVQTCSIWLRGASAERRALVEHALRSAVKRGDADALRLLGYGTKPSVTVERPRFDPREVNIGSRTTVRFVLTSQSAKAQELLVDVAVHFVKANGRAAPKVFKLKRLALARRASVELKSRISFATMTTRRHYPGRHRVDVIVNGVAYPLGEFLVKA